MHNIEANTQVLHRKKMPNGNLIRVGVVTAFADEAKTKAHVSFPGSRTKELVDVSSLEPVSARYQRARVQINPLHRAILLAR